MHHWRLTLFSLCLLSAGPAFSVADSDVVRFVKLSEQFNAQLSKSAIAGLSQDQRRIRAQCILDTLEQQHGRGGVEAVMQLMQVLSVGTEFDDPTVVDFNSKFGDAYNAASRNCLKVARNS